jgi:hypothetical protein
MKPAQNLLATCFTLVFSLANSSTMKIGPIRSSETSVTFQTITRRYNAEYRTFYMLILLHISAKVQKKGHDNNNNNNNIPIIIINMLNIRPLLEN